MPGVKVGDAFVSIEYAHATGDRRQAYHLYIDTPDEEYDDDGRVTRESVDHWAMTHTGDFSDIKDWNADLEVDGQTVVMEWEREESDCEYMDTLGEDY